MARNQRLCVKTAICELMILNPAFKNLPPEPLVANFIASLVLMCVHFSTVQFSMVWYGQRKSRKPKAHMHILARKTYDASFGLSLVT